LEQNKMSEDTKFTINKASQLLQSFSGLIKEGCVSEAVYKDRRLHCEGCDKNQVRKSDNAHFCGGCGCGARSFATLYVEGKPTGEDLSTRLWMPKSNCPKGLHRDEKGTGSLSPVGGRIKQLTEFAVATMSEALGHSGHDDKLEWVNATSDIVESVVENEEELNEVASIVEKELLGESVSDYNQQEEPTNEKEELRTGEINNEPNQQ
jgi:hypothetical protein